MGLPTRCRNQENPDSAAPAAVLPANSRSARCHRPCSANAAPGGFRDRDARAVRQRHRVEHQAAGRPDCRQRRLQGGDAEVKQPVRVNARAADEVSHRADVCPTRAPGELAVASQWTEIDRVGELPAEQHAVACCRASDIGRVQRVPHDIGRTPTAGAVASATTAPPGSRRMATSPAGAHWCRESKARRAVRDEGARRASTSATPRCPSQCERAPRAIASAGSGTMSRPSSPRSAPEPPAAGTSVVRSWIRQNRVIDGDCAHFGLARSEVRVSASRNSEIR